MGPDRFRFFCRCLLTIGFIVIAGAASGHADSPGYFEGIGRAGLHVSNAVRDGCWARADLTQSTLEARAADVGLELVNAIVPPTIILEAVGYRLADRDGLELGCVVSIRFQVVTPGNVKPWWLPGNRQVAALTELYGRSMIVTGPKRDMQTAITENYLNFMTGFLNEWAADNATD